MTVLIIISILLVVWTIGSYIAINNLEEPKFTVVSNKKGYEIRVYEPYIIAEVEVIGNQSEAVNSGFRLIADYIFGNNTASLKIAMTAPVLDEVGESDYEKIAMTVPVLDEELDDNVHKVSFVMPSKYTMENIPKPNNSQVKLKIIEARKVAAYRFSWYATESRVEKKKEKFVEILKRDGIQTEGNVQLAQYNPPFSAPHTRRNELLIEVGN